VLTSVEQSPIYGGNRNASNDPRRVPALTTPSNEEPVPKQPSQYLTPAEYVIKKFGGVRKTAKAIGRDAGAVSKWRQPKDRRGTGGAIPGGAQLAILDAAERLGLDITATDLIKGRRVRTRVVRTTEAVV